MDEREKTAIFLSEHEFEELLGALRRDMRSQRDRAMRPDVQGDMCGLWARQDITLLQILNPKHTKKEALWKCRKGGGPAPILEVAKPQSVSAITTTPFLHPV